MIEKKRNDNPPKPLADTFNEFVDDENDDDDEDRKPDYLSVSNLQKKPSNRKN